MARRVRAATTVRAASWGTFVNRGSSALILPAFMVAVFLLASVPATTAKPPSNIEYEFILDCPERNLGTISPNTIPLKCPIIATDEDDIMGSPSVAVDWRDPTQLILASLHGTDADGPTDRSRGRQPFTTFLSSDHGASWTDRPFQPPGRLRGALGEHPQIYNDLLGHVWVGSLYSRKVDDAPSGWNFTIVPQKFRDFTEARQRQGGSGEYHAKFVPTYFENSLVDQFWFLYDPVTNLMNMLWNERVVHPTDGTELPEADGVKPFSVIGYAYSTPRHQDDWDRVTNRTSLIGPCLKTTNPVISEGLIYVGCMINIDEHKNHTKYAFNKDPQPGQIDVFRFEPGFKNVTHLGAAPVKGGNPKLGVRSDGRMVLFSTGVVGDVYRLVGAWGRADPERNTASWEPPKQYGDDILRPQPGRKLLEANIQDIILREYSGAVHLILKLRYQSLGLSLDNPTAALKSVFEKVITAIHEDYGVMKTYNLDIGNRNNRTSLNSDFRNPDGVFNDLTDDLFELPPDNYTYCASAVQSSCRELGETYQREFFAVGDFGHIIFAELIEITTLRHAAGGQPPPPAPAIASPAATFGIATMAMAVGGTALAGLLALKLVLNRRKDPVAAYVKGGK